MSLLECCVLKNKETLLTDFLSLILTIAVFENVVQETKKGRINSNKV